MKRLLPFAWLALSPLCASAALPGTEGSVPIVIHCTCTDTVGRSFARSLRDEIARSARYKQVSDTEAAIRVDVVSLAVGPDDAGESQVTALSVVFRVHNSLLDQAVQTCGASATDRCARGTMELVDELVTKMAAPGDR